jgi:predicted outer membrane repeat protein
VRIFVVDSGANLTLQNVTVTKGRLVGDFSSGGAINNAGTLTISNSTFSQNSISGHFSSGGAINNAGTLTISNSTFSQNFIFGGFSGGGAINNGGTLTISNSSFSSNSAINGGAINNGGTLTISNSSFSSNATASGGAIFNNGTTTISNSSFSSNAAASGSAIYNDGTTTISNSSFSSNSAFSGGAIYNDGTTTISNSSFSSNSATNGGAIWNNNGQTTTIKNSIIASSASNNCYNLGTWNSQGINFSTDNTCTGFTQKTLTEINLGPLANNGGPTQTLALLAGSQAIDAVSDCTFSGGGNVTQDQRGTIRPQDGQCDLGAFEAELHSLTVNKTGSGSVSDSLSTVDCSALCTLPAVTLVTLTATASPGSYFTSWNDCDSTQGNQCVVNIFNSSKIVTANFATDSTPPSVSVTGVIQGGQYNVGFVPAAGCTTSDSESGVAIPASININPPDNAPGQHTATCSGATDNAGNPQANSVSVTYSVVTTTTCINVQVQASQKVIFSPRTNRASKKTISMTIRNNSGADIQLLAVALDAGKFSGDYTLEGVRTLFGRREVTLPQTIAHRGKLTVKAIVQKAAGTAKETLFAPFFQRDAQLRSLGRERADRILADRVCETERVAQRARDDASTGVHTERAETSE